MNESALEKVKSKLLQTEGASIGQEGILIDVTQDTFLGLVKVLGIPPQHATSVSDVCGYFELAQIAHPAGTTYELTDSDLEDMPILQAA
jgi:hypothetical protein